MIVQPASQVRRRAVSFLLVGVGLVATYGALRGIPWRGDVWIHTIMETAATLLAVLVFFVPLLVRGEVLVGEGISDEISARIAKVNDSERTRSFRDQLVEIGRAHV